MEGLVAVGVGALVMVALWSLLQGIGRVEARDRRGNHRRGRWEAE